MLVATPPAMRIDAATEMARRISPNESATMGRANTANVTPIRSPVRSSPARSLRSDCRLTDRPRTTIASVCVPIASARYTMAGTKYAIARLLSSTRSKRETTTAASMLPARPTRSHGNRCRARRVGGSSSALRSRALSRLIPASRWRSSTCSWRKMSISERAGTAPIKWRASSTTATEVARCRYASAATCS